MGSPLYVAITFCNNKYLRLKQLLVYCKMLFPLQSGLNSKTLKHRKYYLIVALSLLTSLSTKAQNTNTVDTAINNILKSNIITIKGAKYLEGTNNDTIKFDKLVGNVHLQQDNVNLYCDTAYFYTKKNEVIAIGGVIVEQGDSVQIACDKLDYDGNTQQAILTGNAIVTDGSAQISSPNLQYNLGSKMGYYFNGGEIINDEISLNSTTAVYNGNTKNVIYTGNVELVNEKYVLTTDSLHHNLNTEIAEYYGAGSKVTTETNIIEGDGGYFDLQNNVAYFGSRTEIFGDQYVTADSLYYNGADSLYKAYGNAIVQKDSLYVEADTVIYNAKTKLANAFGNAYLYNKGTEVMGNKLFYNQQTGQAEVSGQCYLSDSDIDAFGEEMRFNETTGEGELTGAAELYNESGYIKADTLYFNETNETGTAHSNIIFKDFLKQVTLTGNYLKFRQKDKYVFATDTPYLINVLNGDSVFIKADTLITNASEGEEASNFTAYRNVKVYKTDMQAVCDSFYYDGLDSIFHFTKKSILWVEDNQLKADTIQLYTQNEELKQLQLKNNSFFGSTTFTNLYDQVKGRYITGNFINGKMNNMEVIKNAESLYFLKNEKEEFTAVNKAKSDTIEVIMDEAQKVSNIKFRSKADSTTDPINKVDPFSLKVAGFKWHGDLKPNLNHFSKILNIINQPVN